VVFTGTSASPNTGFLTINSYLNKKIPGTCTLTINPVLDPSKTITRTSRPIGPTEITQASNDGSSMCGNLFDYGTDLLGYDLGTYRYTMSFVDDFGYITAKDSGTTPPLQ
jgi:hypothetical protein